MVILRGLSMKLYKVLRIEFDEIDDNKTQIIDTRGDEPLIDVVLPNDIKYQFSNDTGYSLITNRDNSSVFAFTNRDVEYVEIK